MRKSALLFCGIYLAASLYAQAIPPYHLHPELSSSGLVLVSWELSPIEGLNEDFEDGMAQDFEWWTPQNENYPGQGYYTIQNGYAQINSGVGLLNWGSAANSQHNFADFTCEVEMVNTYYGDSHGIIFRSNGPKNNDFNGYIYAIGNTELFGGMYSVYAYIDGLGLSIINWQWSDLINIGPNSYNTIKVVGVYNTFDFYINGVYVNSVTNPLYNTGLVGIANTSSNTVQYYDFTSSYDAQLQDRSVVPQRGTPVTGWFDEAGRPVDHPPRMYDPNVHSLATPRVTLPYQSQRRHDTDELDEFIEFHVYRNGQFIAATEDSTFTDQLPGYGEYEYTVVAVYDEGESVPSVPATVNYQPVTYSLAPVQHVVPYTGGTITYEGLLFSELQQPVQGVVYRGYVTGPLQQTVGPVMQRTFTLTPGMYLTPQNLSFDIPADAPPGNYFFHGRLYHQGQLMREQTFQFDKMGGGD